MLICAALLLVYMTAQLSHFESGHAHKFTAPLGPEPAAPWPGMATVDSGLAISARERSTARPRLARGPHAPVRSLRAPRLERSKRLPGVRPASTCNRYAAGDFIVSLEIRARRA